MSYFDDASLVFIPSGTKTSKAYSVKPIDGTGDLTFSRSNDTASRVASNGLIERVRTNLVPNGLSFFAATGVLYTTVTSDSPISGVSSTRITKNEAAGTLRYGNQNVSASALTGSISYTISRYFKYDGYNLTTSMEFNNSGQWGGTSWVQNIDIASTGVTLQAPSNCTSKITNVGNGWYRVDVTVVNGASPSGSPVTHLLKVDSTLSTGQGFLTAAPQLETGDIATDYILTTTAAVSVGPVANVPRLDYLNSSCPRLLLEPQRTNAIRWSEQINTTNWPSSTQINVTANALVSPDGYQNADVIIPNTTNGNHGPAQNVSGLTSGATYSCSIYAKAQGYSKFLILAGAGTGSGQYEFNLAAGTAQAGATITSVGNGWYRCTAPLVPNSSLLQYLIFISNGSAYSYAGNGTSGIAFWGAQLEAGAYATSYINTLNSAVTRGADSCSKTGISSLIGQTEGTLYAEANIRANKDSVRALQASDGTTNNRIQLAFIGNDFSPAIVTGGVVQAGITVPFTAGNNKFAIAYANNDVVAYLNGVQVLVDNSATIPTCSVLDVGQSLTANTNTLGDPISQALLFKTRLTNAQLAELTSL